MLLRRNHLLIAGDKHPGWIPNANMRLLWQCWTHSSGRRVCLLSPSTGGRSCQWGEGQAQYFKQVILYCSFSCFKNRYHPFFLIGTICHSLSLIFTHWTVHEYLFTLPGQLHMCVCVCVHTHACMHLTSSFCPSFLYCHERWHSGRQDFLNPFLWCWGVPTHVFHIPACEATSLPALIVQTFPRTQPTLNSHTIPLPSLPSWWNAPPQQWSPGSPRCFDEVPWLEP